ncbi:beta-ketoacyl-ACP synthase III [Rhodococcus sp. G-MC3]|uniref:beta-ketoacyl-ACP synthase III n=1 Tax=Rhodococcus sp. G-MC3 TaxID=3046209 RepID=UPI0024BA8425|nr:beta-ketoacyl-ACP synthase III [Rhodococcus sp. G-MC3]MDJ0396224.1 beta-ketoacyl-ACP synthase III [Rhodococcus sp. G-MC3]
MNSAAVLSGLGSWLPPTVVTNAMLAERFDTSDQWITSRTGIEQRHVVTGGLATSDMAVEAGMRAMKSAGTDRVDMLIVATTTPDRRCPATAPEVAARLGLGRIAAFDVAAVCSGFLYALSSAVGAIASRQADTVLVIGSESFTTLLDPADRSTNAIFGDGAGAAIVRAGDRDEPGAILSLDLGSDGSLADLIAVGGGGSRTRPENPELDPYFRMQGGAVFLEAVRRMEESTRAVLAATGWATDDLDRLVGHQANLRIITALAEQLDLPAEAAVTNIDRVGNTAGASIPIALVDAVDTGRIKPGHKVALTAFGGGATWGAATLVWPEIDII